MVNMAQVQQAFLNLWKVEGIKERILFTLAMLALLRFGVHVPVAGVDHARLSGIFGGGNMLAGFLDLFSGGALAKFSILALGITPYINASIIMQLMASVIPKLEELQKEGGEQGRKQIAQWTRYLTVVLALIQAYGITRWLWASNAVLGHPAAGPWPWMFIISTMVIMVTGTIFVMWLGELVTERGIGNGASLIIMAGILARMPHYFSTTSQGVTSGAFAWWQVTLLTLSFLGILVAIVIVQEGARKIPVQAAKKQVGGRAFQQRSSYIPFKVNQGGVMPIIFASSLLLFPVTISQLLGNQAQAVSAKVNWAFNTAAAWHWDNIRNALQQGLQHLLTALSPSGWLYAVLYLALIVFFSYFYASLVLNPQDLAKNLQKFGNFIPGVRPGKPTADYLEQVLSRITFIGAIFLGLVAIVPNLIENATGVNTFQGLGATALLIMVGVAIDLYNQLQTQLLARQYEGFMK
ncbi:MAG TPA: preprotein translocase subunit SecY [Stenomitos sp.]